MVIHFARACQWSRDRCVNVTIRRGMAIPFGKYALQRKLAEGGMAEVFLARQGGVEGFEKLVVVKRILPALVKEQDFIKMFLNEARVAARLNHPNIVQIWDLGIID